MQASMTQGSASPTSRSRFLLLQGLFRSAASSFGASAKLGSGVIRSGNSESRFSI